MSGEPDISSAVPTPLQEAEEACERLQGEIESAKKVLRDYRATLIRDRSDNDNR